MKYNITIADASLKFCVHPNTIRRWIRVGAISAIKDDDGRWKISKQEVKKLLAERLKKLENITRKKD